jgi:protein TonB
MVILLHGAALAALVMAKMDMPTKAPIVRTEVRLIKIPPVPKEIPPDPVEDVKPTQIDRFEQIVPVPPPPRPGEDLTFTRTEETGTTVGPVYPEARPQPEARPEPKPEPVRRDARIDPRSELKPPYPRTQQIEGNEGTVTVRVRIGADGRVKGAEKIRATNDDFFQATLRHALRNWRFKPATVDGRPIESSKVMTLHFSLEGDG